MIRLSQPIIGDEERAAVLAVLDSGQLAQGPVVQEFEDVFAHEVAHTRHAVAVANGTAALHIALLAHDIGTGDEVITTPFTFQAAGNMILATGARPVFVDIGEDGNIAPSLIEAAVTPRTKAILPVDLYGRLCDMRAIEIVAETYSLPIIEDAAQAHGASLGGRCAGSFGTGCFSFYATKNMTTGEGGMVTTDDDAIADKLRRLRSHGESERYNSVEIGYNYRMTDISAAIGLPQINRLSEQITKRRANAAYLSANLRGVTPPPEPVEPDAHVWHQYTIRVQERDALRAWLREREIETGVYYPYTLPAQPLYRDLGYSEGTLPRARQFAAEALSLPVHPSLTRDDLQSIVHAVNEWAESRATSKVRA